VKKTSIKIHGYKELEIAHIVLDYNGTLAKDGILKEEVKELLPKLAEMYSVHVITADTFGSVQNQMQDFAVHVKVLTSDNHTLEKEEYIKSLNATLCAAIGNGNNDVLMLKSAEIGIVLLGDEGCATATLVQSDLVCKNIKDALELFLYRDRLIATLRR